MPQINDPNQVSRTSHSIRPLDLLGIALMVTYLAITAVDLYLAPPSRLADRTRDQYRSFSTVATAHAAMPAPGSR